MQLSLETHIYTRNHKILQAETLEVVSFKLFTWFEGIYINNDDDDDKNNNTFHDSRKEKAGLMPFIAVYSIDVRR